MDDDEYAAHGLLAVAVALTDGATDTSSLPPKAQEAIAHRDANWIAAIEGAASVGEVAKIGNQISEAREMSPAVRAAFDERLAKVRKN
jgi:hypothetical protein